MLPSIRLFEEEGRLCRLNRDSTSYYQIMQNPDAFLIFQEPTFVRIRLTSFSVYYYMKKNVHLLWKRTNKFVEKLKKINRINKNILPLKSRNWTHPPLEDRQAVLTLGSTHPSDLPLLHWFFFPILLFRS